MSYTNPPSVRIPYDIDGTTIGYNDTTSYANGIITWMASGVATELNDENLTTVWGNDVGPGGSVTVDKCIWFFFPERRTITNFLVQLGAWGNYETTQTFYEVQGSNNTTNGIDGTWETATLLDGTPAFNANSADWWRVNIKRVSFTQAMKVVRFRFHLFGKYYNDGGAKVFAIHWYGNKLAGETPDDIIFLDNDTAGTPEFTAVKDFGDRPEGTSAIANVSIKNTSSTKTANTLGLSLTGVNLTMSFDQQTWVTTLNIASLAPGEVSNPIYIKDAIGQPPQTLGPKAGRLVVTVGSWV